MKKRILIIILMICSIFFISCGNNKKINDIPTDREIKIGESFLLDTDYNIINNSEDIVSVSKEGIVKGLKTGTALITLSNGSNIYKITVTVSDNVTKSIKVDCKQTITINEKVAIKPTVINGDSTYTYTYKSNDESVCSVDSNGEVTGLSYGICTITINAIGKTTITKDLIMYVKNNTTDVNVVDTINNTSYSYTGDIDMTDLNGKINNVYEKYKDSIVGVSNYQYVSVSYWSRETKLQEVSVGTGVIYKKIINNDLSYTYYVLTNNHVVDGASELKIYFGYDNEYVSCKKECSSSDLDLAVVSFISKKEYITVPFALDNSVKVGDFAIAIGNSNGYMYFGTTTFGIISYVNRKMDSEKAVFYQHDVAINPGNSGGPLLNINGEIIGINTMKIVESDVDNIGFSITIETVKNYLTSQNLL